MNDQFEYKVVPSSNLHSWDGFPSQADLNGYGSNGWELVTIFRDQAVFKRKLADDND